MNVALIGYGYWGKIVSRYIKSSNCFSLVKTYSKDQIDNSFFTKDINDILLDDTIQAVFICTPTSTHYSICKQMLENKKHVFCEKPIVESEEQFAILLQIAERNKRILYTDYIYTVSPSINMIKNHLSQIGKIKNIRCEISQFGLFYPDDTVYGTIGLHMLSVIFYLFGYNYNNIFYENFLGSPNCSSGEIKLVLLNKSVAQVFCSLVSATKERSMAIYGEKGMFFFNVNKTPSLTMLLYELEGNAFVIKEKKEWNLDEENNLKLSIMLFSSYINKKNYASNNILSQTILGALNREIKDDLR